jgi:hypothetical protein
VVSGRRAVVVLHLGGCAATGVTLRSNHYRLFVPPEWQLVVAGGDAGIPTLLRVPPPTGVDGPPVEIRLYAWLVQGPLPDASAAALQRLAAASTLDLQTARPDEPCGDWMNQCVLFGEPARVSHIKTSAGRHIALVAGDASGSLVAVVALAASTPSCHDLETIDAALKRVAGQIASAPDVSRPAPRPIILEDPSGGRSSELPPADPALPP